MFKITAMPVSAWKRGNPSRNVNQSIPIEHLIVISMLTQKAFYDERLFRATMTEEGPDRNGVLGEPFLACAFRLSHMLDFYERDGMELTYQSEHGAVVATLKAKADPIDPDLLKAGIRSGKVICHLTTPMARVAHLFSTGLALLCSQWEQYDTLFPWMERYRMLLDDFESAFLLEDEQQLFLSMNFMFNVVQSLEVKGDKVMVYIKDWRYELSSTHPDSVFAQTEFEPTDKALN